jgi:DNA invertase Pin-like site-specific DNA recombinase
LSLFSPALLTSLLLARIILKRTFQFVKQKGRTMNSTTYIAYYRVSTTKQGASGAGLDAQRALVESFVAGRGGRLVGEYTDVESGSANNRDGLTAAMEECRRTKAVLLVAKLDRLSRRVSMIASLMESGLPFVVAEMPEASPMVLHMMAAFAEHERHMIAQRTKAALAAKKAAGVQLGNPRWSESVEAARQVKTAKRSAHRDGIAPMVKRYRQDGLSLQAIANKMNEQGIPPVAATAKESKGGVAKTRRWSATTVHRILAVTA